MRHLTLIFALLSLPLPALAVDAVTGASRREQQAGTDAAIWITGRGFDPGATVSISGDGLMQTADPAIVPEAERVDGGRGDGITYRFSIDRNASPGPRDITVTGGDGSSATGVGLIEIVAPDPNQPPPDPDAAPPPAGDPDAGAPPPNPGADAGEDPPPPQGQPGEVDIVTRASPSAGEQGAQVNLWIVGRSFSPGLTVTFSNPALGPAEFEGQPIGAEVVRAAESEQQMADGIQYFLRIPSDADPGQVDITVTNPNGTSATGQGIFRVLRPGEIPPPEPGAGDLDGITGASPRAGRAGHNVSLWLWGEGFETGAKVRFSSPAIQPYAEAEVIKNSTSHPGYSGMRLFLQVDGSALPGPVTIVVTNPNGTSVEAAGLFEIVEDAAGGGGAYVEDGGPCPDVLTSIEAISRVTPDRVEPGEAVSLTIEGRAFACGASVRIGGGGLEAVGEPRLVRSAEDPALTALIWDIQVKPDATPGSRDVTVINPNNSSKTLESAFLVVGSEVGAEQTGTAFCRATPARDVAPWALICLLALRRRR